MSKPALAQSLAKNNGREAYYGTQTLGCPTIRPDGKVVKVTMLDPRDPGYEAGWQDHIIKTQAARGSAALLAAMQRVKAA